MFSLFHHKAASLLNARFFLSKFSTMPGRQSRLLALSILIMLLVSAIGASPLVYKNIYRIAHRLISPRAYAAAPVLALGFNEGSGTTTADASGNGNTGTLLGGVTWTTAGKYGKALSFDGSSGVVRIPDNPSWKVDGLTGYTLKVKVKG